MKAPKTPKILKSPGKKFWKAVLSEYEFTEAHDLERLKHACQVVDDLKDDEETVKQEGRFIQDRFQQVKEHPAVKSIRENRVLFCRIIRELGIDLQTTESRLPRQY